MASKWQFPRRRSKGSLKPDDKKWIGKLRENDDYNHSQETPFIAKPRSPIYLMESPTSSILHQRYQQVLNKSETQPCAGLCPEQRSFAAIKRGGGLEDEDSLFGEL